MVAGYRELGAPRKGFGDFEFQITLLLLGDQAPLFALGNGFDLRSRAAYDNLNRVAKLTGDNGHTSHLVGRVQRVHGRENQVQQDLMKIYSVYSHRRAWCAQFQIQGNAARRHTVRDEYREVTQKYVHIQRLHLEILTVNERTQPIQNSPCEVALIPDVDENLPQIEPVLLTIKHANRCGGVCADGRQRVYDGIRNQFAERDVGLLMALRDIGCTEGQRTFVRLDRICTTGLLVLRHGATGPTLYDSNCNIAETSL
jgi:hypothetical protein